MSITPLEYLKKLKEDACSEGEMSEKLCVSAFIHHLNQIFALTTSEEDRLKEELIKVKYECYREYLKLLDEEYLSFEYCDHIGNEDGDLDRLSGSDIIEKLEDWVSNALFDDPMYHPINNEYLSACQGKQ